ncbi:MAG: hypothetical protein IJS32_05420 [Kiritimatiellae bacterium]|nr:hypothetical protein [Kiritimatiellia bacterium]
MQPARAFVVIPGHVRPPLVADYGKDPAFDVPDGWLAFRREVAEAVSPSLGVAPGAVFRVAFTRP